MNIKRTNGAQKNKAIVILLAQLDEKTHTIRYSRAIKEHANTWIWWHLHDEDRETGVCTWNLGKSRGSSIGSFDMRMDLEHMRIYDAENENENHNHTEQKETKQKINKEDDDF